MSKEFHYFTLAEIYEYAKKLGYSKDEVEIEEVCNDYYEVSFGHVFTEVWLWSFSSLEEVAFDYEHIVWCD